MSLRRGSILSVGSRITCHEEEAHFEGESNPVQRDKKFFASSITKRYIYTNIKKKNSNGLITKRETRLRFIRYILEVVTSG